MSNAKRKHNASRDVGVQRPHGNIDGSIPSATRETRAARRMHATRNARHFAPERVKRQLGRTPKIERRPQTAETGRRMDERHRRWCRRRGETDHHVRHSYHARYSGDGCRCARVRLSDKSTRSPDKTTRSAGYSSRRGDGELERRPSRYSSQVTARGRQGMARIGTASASRGPSRTVGRPNKGPFLRTCDGDLIGV